MNLAQEILTLIQQRPGLPLDLLLSRFAPQVAEQLGEALGALQRDGFIQVWSLCARGPHPRQVCFLNQRPAVRCH